MATFYKYQERDLDSQVNYADIGLGISNLVTDQLATRKAKKEAYDDQVRAFNQYLDEHPIGDEENMTEWTASYASQMQQKMLANQRAFKNGRVSERDNVVFMQNVQNGTKTMFDLSADYQAEYKDKMERMNAADPANRSQGAETWLIEQFESFSNFKQTTPIINDKTGLLLLSKKNENGTFDTVSAADMATRIKAKYNYFDIDKATTDSEAIMGRFVTAAVEERAARGKQGMTSEEENKLNIQNKEKFDKGLATQTAVYLSIPNNTMSVLTNSIGVTESGKAYTWTFSKEEAANDPMKILMVQKAGSVGPPQPDFTTENGKKQQAVANKFYGDMLKSKVDYQGKVDVTSAISDAPQQQEWQYLAARGGRDEKEYTKNMTNNLAKLYGGTEAEIEAVTPYLRDYDKTIKSVSRKNGVLVIERYDVNKDGVILKNKVSSKDYPFKTKTKVNGKIVYNPIPFDDWLQGTALGLAGISDVNDAINSTSQNYKSFKNYANDDGSSQEFRSDVIQQKQDGGTSSAGKGSTAAAGIN
jgi:hypothetical protein